MNPLSLYYCVTSSPIPSRPPLRMAAAYASFFNPFNSSDTYRPFNQVLLCFFYEIQTTYHAVTLVCNPIKSCTHYIGTLVPQSESRYWFFLAIIFRLLPYDGVTP